MVDWDKIEWEEFDHEASSQEMLANDPVLKMLRRDPVSVIESKRFDSKFWVLWYGDKIRDWADNNGYMPCMQSPYWGRWIAEFCEDHDPEHTLLWAANSDYNDYQNIVETGIGSDQGADDFVAVTGYKDGKITVYNPRTDEELERNLDTSLIACVIGKELEADADYWETGENPDDSRHPYMHVCVIFDLEAYR